jgi:hypothetical protein
MIVGNVVGEQAHQLFVVSASDIGRFAKTDPAEPMIIFRNEIIIELDQYPSIVNVPLDQ